MSFSRSEYTNYSNPHDYPSSDTLKELAAPGYFTGEPPALIHNASGNSFPDIELDINAPEQPKTSDYLPGGYLRPELRKESDPELHVLVNNPPELEVAAIESIEDTDTLRTRIADKLTSTANMLATTTTRRVGRSAMFAFDKIRPVPKGKHVLPSKYRKAPVTSRA